MRLWTFAHRNALEILRDPLSYCFGLGFPVVVLLMLAAIQKNVPAELYALPELLPGITVFGFSFLSLFAAQLVSKDIASAFLARLLITPMKAVDFILGYTLPLLPAALLQITALGVAACILGLPVSFRLLPYGAVMLLTAVFFIVLGLLFGSILNEKQVGGICGAVLTNLSAWFGGAWFDLELIGKGFYRIAAALPFVHAVEFGRGLLQDNTAAVSTDMLWVLGYVLVCTGAAVSVFCYRSKRL